ncbi:MAG: LEA type 2 family protein [Spirochaetota bacterium]
MNKYILLIFFVFSYQSCSNPIEKRLEALKKCKVHIVSLRVSNFKLLLPPVPKVYFKAKVSIENTNEIPVTLEKFDFTILQKLGGLRKNISLANVLYKESVIIPPLQSKTIPLELVTKFEDNRKPALADFLKNLLKAYLTGEELTFVLDGNADFTTSLGTLTIPVTSEKKLKLRNN